MGTVEWKKLALARKRADFGNRFETSVSGAGAFAAQDFAGVDSEFTDENLASNSMAKHVLPNPERIKRYPWCATSNSDPDQSGDRQRSRAFSFEDST